MIDSQRFRFPSYQVRRKVFKIFGGSFDVYGPDGSLVLFASQKAFKLKEDIRLYADKDKAHELLVIKARNIIDFSAAYDVEDPVSGRKLGAFKRKGWSSLLRDQWIVMDVNDQDIGSIKEDNAMMALLRRLMPLIPQSYHCEVHGVLACTYKQNLNPSSTSCASNSRKRPASWTSASASPVPSCLAPSKASKAAAAVSAWAASNLPLADGARHRAYDRAAAPLHCGERPATVQRRADALFKPSLCPDIARPDPPPEEGWARCARPSIHLPTP